MIYLLVSPLLLTVERYNSYEEANNRRIVIGSQAWKIYKAEDVG